MSDPITGMIRVQEDGYDTANTQITDQITSMSERNSQIEASMNSKLQSADALVAQLMAQQTTVNAVIQSVNYVTYGKLVNPSTGQ